SGVCLRSRLRSYSESFLLTNAFLARALCVRSTDWRSVSLRSRTGAPPRAAPAAPCAAIWSRLGGYELLENGRARGRFLCLESDTHGSHNAYMAGISLWTVWTSSGPTTSESM